MPGVDRVEVKACCAWRAESLGGGGTTGPGAVVPQVDGVDVLNFEGGFGLGEGGGEVRRGGGR